MPARRPKKHVEEGHENAERWLLTYADMITLLMVLFIVLFSISRTDLEKFTKLREGLAQSFGTETPALQGTSGVLQGARIATGQGDIDAGSSAGITLEQAAAVEKEKLADVKEEIQKELAKDNLTQQVQIENKQRGLVITVLTDDLLFDLGRATLRPAGRDLIAGLAGALSSVPNQIVVEGHTDNQPIRGGGQFATNWELSTARATTVLRYLIETKHLPASRMSAAGYADQRPIAPNDTQANKQLNRRVEIVVVSAVDQPAAFSPPTEPVTTGEPAAAGEPTSATEEHSP